MTRSFVGESEILGPESEKLTVAQAIDIVNTKVLETNLNGQVVYAN